MRIVASAPEAISRRTVRRLRFSRCATSLADRSGIGAGLAVVAGVIEFFLRRGGQLAVAQVFRRCPPGQQADQRNKGRMRHSLDRNGIRRAMVSVLGVSGGRTRSRDTADGHGSSIVPHAGFSIPITTIRNRAGYEEWTVWARNAVLTPLGALLSPWASTLHSATPEGLCSSGPELQSRVPEGRRCRGSRTPP